MNSGSSPSRGGRYCKDVLCRDTRCHHFVSVENISLRRAVQRAAEAKPHTNASSNGLKNSSTVHGLSTVPLMASQQYRQRPQQYRQRLLNSTVNDLLAVACRLNRPDHGTTDALGFTKSISHYCNHTYVLLMRFDRHSFFLEQTYPRACRWSRSRGDIAAQALPNTSSAYRATINRTGQCISGGGKEAKRVKQITQISPVSTENQMAFFSPRVLSAAARCDLHNTRRKYCNCGRYHISFIPNRPFLLIVRAVD